MIAATNTRENILSALLRWRYLVLAIELAVAGGFAFSGWQLLHQPPDPGPVATTSGPEPGLVPAPSPAGLPVAAMPGVAHTAARPFRFSLSGDLLNRVNRDDYQLYGEQWRIVRTLTEAMRTYIQQRVIPNLLSGIHKEARW